MSRSRRIGWMAGPGLALALLAGFRPAAGGVPTPVPAAQRGTLDAERSGTHDAANIRTTYWNYGMVGDYPADPGNVDLSVFHSAEVPRGSGMNYSDGITPFVLAKIRQRSGLDAYIMETGFRERQGISPYNNRVMRFEPRPGYFMADPAVNRARAPAISNDRNTWPARWPDKLDDLFDPGWSGSWNGYFGKQVVADQESYCVMDDQSYNAWDFYPDSRDETRRGLGLRIEVRGFQWANPQASNVIFWHYDITNEGTTDFDDNIIFGLYMDSGVGGSALSCDGIYESDDDNAFFDRTFDRNIINLVYTWDKNGHGRNLSSNCARSGYLGYAYLETPGNSTDDIDNDEDGLTNEARDGGPGTLIVGKEAIRAAVTGPLGYHLARFQAEYGPLENRPAYKAGRWWTGDEDLDWTAELQDLGEDGKADTGDPGEGDGIPTAGEPNFDRTDLNESDQIGLTGFKMNRIRAGYGNPDPTTDGVLFYTDSANWPERLYEQFTDPDSAKRFDPPVAANYNIGFLFASGPFQLKAGKTERFSLALGHGADLAELRRTVRTVQQIYNANYRFAVPPPMPTLTAEAGDGLVRLSWDDVSERGADPVTGEFDFEGYRIYRSTDPTFQDPRVITTATGSGPIGNGRPIAQFDLADGRYGFSPQTVEGVAYNLGAETGLTHTWVDTTVTNGELYYYAITAYDFGSDSLGFYPSENAISVRITTRGGVNLPQNVVAVRPEPRVAGFVGAATDSLQKVAGNGTGSVAIEVVNSNLVPDGHLMAITFAASPDSIRAAGYALVDSTLHTTLFKLGQDLEGLGVGAVGAGLLPVIATAKYTVVDTARSGFAAGSPTNVRLKAAYQDVLPRNLRRAGYPDDITVTFEDAVVDSSIYDEFEGRRFPARFRIAAHTPTGDRRLDFIFYDSDQNGTLSRTDEYIDILTSTGADLLPPITWRLQIAAPAPKTITAPKHGDVYQLRLTRPLNATDVYLFTARGQRVDAAQARLDFQQAPYVVPNPYVASSAFEPERFAVSGRGERRLEFRGLPESCTIRIYTVRGELVKTLVHQGSTQGMEPWNLRTKDNLDVAPGLYIYHVDAVGLGSHVGKFAIIK